TPRSVKAKTFFPDSSTSSSSAQRTPTLLVSWFRKNFLLIIRYHFLSVRSDCTRNLYHDVVYSGDLQRFRSPVGQVENPLFHGPRSLIRRKTDRWLRRLV